MALDFDRVGAAALAQGARLCAEWLGGKQEGHEWVGARKAQGGRGDSWKVNLTTGVWSHFGGDEKGGDLISLYAALRGLSQGAALEAVAAQLGMLNGAAGAPQAAVRPALPTAAHSAPPKPTDDAPALPIPPDAGLPPPHKKHGAAQAEYAYPDADGRLLFVVARYALSGGDKTFCPWTWRRGRWTPVAYPAPRPLYGLRLALQRPQTPVLVVEGEKCADAANAVLTGYTAVTWAGGSNAVKTADWTPLKGRPVDIWPDADAPGRAAAAQLAAILLAQGCSVRVLDVSGQPEGWDVAEAVGAGIPLGEFMTGRWTTVSAQRAPEPGPSNPAITVAERPSANLIWQQAGIVGAGKANDNGIPHPMVSNVAAILETCMAFGKSIWYDDFRGRMYCTEHGVSRAWTDADDTLALKFIQHTALLHKVNLKTIQQATYLVAIEHRRNSVHEYLNALTWDGVPRLEDWTIDYLGTAGTAYTRAVARNWLISMVARAMTPGCQADYMPVLEGPSALKKSTALAILGGEWHKRLDSKFGSKEFKEDIQGAWLIELPDMAAFSQREHLSIISFISNPTDSFRAAYGKHSEQRPRTCIFSGSSETSDYIKGWQGIRRWWPLRCGPVTEAGKIDAEGLKAMRDQIFAEALIEFRKGATWHETPETETRLEQEERQAVDPWLERIAEYCHARAEVTLREILEDCLFLTAREQTRREEMRVSNCLKLLGYMRTVRREGEITRRYYVRP